jgi:hypothetical protein
MAVTTRFSIAIDTGLAGAWRCAPARGRRGVVVKGRRLGSGGTIAAPWTAQESQAHVGRERLPAAAATPPEGRRNGRHRGGGGRPVNLGCEATLVRHGAGVFVLSGVGEGRRRNLLTGTPAPRALDVKLPSARAALVPLSRLAAALTTRLAGAFAAAVLLSAVALAAQQHLRLAAGTAGRVGQSWTWAAWQRS